MKKYLVFDDKEEIGYVYRDGNKWWGSVSYACERYSGGLQGHDMINTKSDAIEDVKEMDRNYSS